MSLSETWYKKEWPRVLAAFLINAVFLVFMLSCFAPRFETNDDVLMSKFVDGQFSVKTAYVPFLHICLGWFLKLLYTLGGNGFNWYSLCQYLVLYLGFTAITWSLLRRFRLFPALVMTLVILGSFGADSYLSMNFSKASAAGTVGGMTLMVWAMRNESGTVRRLPLILGMALALAGYCWRFEEFGVCALLMAGLCLHTLLDMAGEDRELAAKEKLARAVRYVLPFFILACMAVGLFAFNSFMWNRPEIRDYTKFDYSRSLLIDFEIPEYDQMSEVYDSLGIDENFAYMMKNWSFYDTEKFTQESLDIMIEARDNCVNRKTPGECLGVFLNECLMGFTKDRSFPGLVFMLALWLACGRRRWSEWVSLAYQSGMFLIMYMFMIYSERYLVNRVDIGLFLAMAVGLSFFLDERKLSDEKLLCAAVLILSLFISWRSCRKQCIYDSHNTLEDRSFEKAAVDTILRDDEHLYFVKVWSIEHNMYGPLETPPETYADRIVHIGGWSMHHPVMEALLDSWDIENPYKDIVNRDDIYIIDDDVERTVRYIGKYYYPDAAAERIEPLSTETGLNIYRIVG